MSDELAYVDCFPVEKASVGYLADQGYDGNDEATTYSGSEVFECEACGSLVRDHGRAKHYSFHVNGVTIRK